MNRRYTIIIGIAAILAAGFIFYLRLPKEPRYHGRSLSQWLKPGSYHDGSATENTPFETLPYPGEDTHEAVQAIGTNALPFLIEWLNAKDSKPRAAITSWLNEHLAPHFHFLSAREKQSIAYVGFDFLGDKAKPASSFFAALTFDSDPERRICGLDCLLSCQADETVLFPIIQRILDGNDQQLRDHLAFILQFTHDSLTARIYRRFPQLAHPEAAVAK